MVEAEAKDAVIEAFASAGAFCVTVAFCVTRAVDGAGARGTFAGTSCVAAEEMGTEAEAKVDAPLRIDGTHRPLISQEFLKMVS